MRPYGSFGEFYQFVGRGIRIIPSTSLTGNLAPGQQFLDVIYHAEMGLDEHIDTIYTENDMAPPIIPYEPGLDEGPGLSGDSVAPDEGDTDPGNEGVSRAPETYVLFEQGSIEQRVVHDQVRIEQRRAEREHEAFAQRYAVYAQSTPAPMPFEQFVKLMRMLSE